MSLREVVRRSRRTLSYGKEQASARLTSALSMGSIQGVGRPTQRNDKGWTVLHLAAMHSKPQTVRLLIQQGCKVTDKDIEGNTPLHLAAENGNREAVRVLLYHGSKLSDKNNQGFSALHLAVKAGKENIVQLFLQHNDINVDQKTSTGNRTSLHLSAATGRTDIARALLHAGASIRARASLGWTSLHFSSREGRVEMTDLLLEKGARFDVVTTGQWTPLMFAAAHNQLGVAKLLIRRGADLNKVNRDGLTAEAIAAGKGMDRMVAVLKGQPDIQHSSDEEESSPETSFRHINRLEHSRSSEALQDHPAARHQTHLAVEETYESDDDIQLNADERETLEHLQSQLMARVKLVDEVREENLHLLKEKERKISGLAKKLLEARNQEEKLRDDLERAKKDVRDILVKEAVAKNSFEKAAKTGAEKLKESERSVLTIKKELYNLKEMARDRNQEEKRRGDLRTNLSKSTHSINIESELECPICFEMSRPPIYQCPEGHIICNECRPRVSRCPVCRFEFTGLPNIRNRYVERLSLAFFEEDENNI